MAAVFPDPGNDENCSKELENQARKPRRRELQRWDQGLPWFMTAHGVAQRRLRRWIETSSNDERGGIGSLVPPPRRRHTG